MNDRRLVFGILFVFAGICATEGFVHHYPVVGVLASMATAFFLIAFITSKD